MYAPNNLSLGLSTGTGQSPEPEVLPASGSDSQRRSQQEALWAPGMTIFG